MTKKNSGPMNPGDVVEYLQGKELALGFCLGPDNKGKLPVMSVTGRKESVATKKVLFRHSSPLAPTAIREDVLSHLADVLSKKESDAGEIDTEELWELLGEEDQGKEWDPKELAGYLFSEPDTWERSVLYRALLGDRHRFSRKGDHFLLRSRAQVEEALLRETAEAQREVEKEIVSEWMRSVWEGEDQPVPAEHRELLDKWKERIKQVAIFKEEASHFQHVQRFLKTFEIKNKDTAFEFMIRLGEFTADENLEILANQTPLTFSDEVIEEANRAGERLSEVLNQDQREDLTGWACYSIDDPDTTEIDDALAWRECPDGYELAIHISDTSALVTPDFEKLEKEIRYRATSVYLPDLRVPMLPKSLSEEILSLRTDEIRPAFTILQTIDHEGKLKGVRFFSSLVKITECLDYDEVDQRIASGDEYWCQFQTIVGLLKSQRQAAGAIDLPFPRMDVVVSDEGITLVPEDRDSVAQSIVSEMMILANRAIANYFVENEIPAIFRGQQPPNPPIEERQEWLPHHLYEARRSFSRSTQGTEPAAHSSLGIESYVQATSPIRRYRDLVLQRQIKHHLSCGEVLYPLEELEEIITITSTPTSQADRMERNRKSYFLHKLLFTQRGKEVPAIILAVSGERYVLQLCDSLREVDVPHGSETIRAPGEQVKVKIISVYPRDRVIKVSSPL